MAPEPDAGDDPDLHSAMAAHNRRLMAQIGDRLRAGFDAALQGGDYCVIRSHVTGVMSVLAATAARDRGDALFGPVAFSQCIDYVNSTVVTRMANSDGLEPGTAPDAPARSEQQGRPT